MKKSILLFSIFLCGFTRENYKIETIENNGTKLQFYIPKDYCKYKNKNLDRIMDDILKENDNDKYNQYSYKKCDSIKKIQKGERVESSGEISILIPKKDVVALFNDKKSAEYFINTFPESDKESFDKLRKKLEAANINSILKKEKLNKWESKYIKLSFDETKQYFSPETTNTYKIIKNNLIVNSKFNLNNDKYTINRFTGFAAGLMIDIAYEDKNNSNELVDENVFAEYIVATQQLNKSQVNSYFNKRYEIINIKLPNFDDFQDVSKIKSMNGFFHSKMFLQYSKNEKDFSNIFIGINISIDSFNIDLLHDMIKKLFPNNEIEKIDNTKYPYIKLNVKINDKSGAVYYYPFKIKNFNLFLVASMYYNKENNDKKIQNYAEKYIKYLTRVNKDL